MMAESQKITKGMTVAQVFEKYPETKPVFLDYGLYCVGCPMSQSETIEQAAKANEMDLKKLLRDLNKALS